MRRTADASDEPHVPFIEIGLAFSLLGGFTLAIALPIESALHIGTSSWVAHAQIHGHLQAIGFVALAIVGVSYHLLPAFEGRALSHAELTRPSLYLLTLGVLLRVIGQPLAAIPAFGATMALGAYAEFAGALCFATVVFGTVRISASREPSRLLFLAAAGWFVVQAALGAWWLTSAAVRHASALPAIQDNVLVASQLLGFDLLFILGVGIRSFPVFFGIARPRDRELAVPVVAWQLGLLSVAMSPVLEAASSDAAQRAYAAGLLLIGLGVGWVTARTGWWRSPARIRPGSRPFALPIQFAMGWLTLASLLFIGLGMVSLASGRSPNAFRVDAVRHVIAVGVVLTTIVAMAQLVLPEFASERLNGPQSSWRGVGLGALLAFATVLRAGARWWSDVLPPDLVNASMSVAGVLALGVMAAFAFLYLRSVRNHHALVARFAQMSRDGTAWSIAPVAQRSRTPGDRS